MKKRFEKLFLLGRPASGKSEFIDFMKKVPAQERIEKYHIGPFEEMDDFPWIWEKFVEDDIWERAGYKRLYSTGGEHPGLAPHGEPFFDFCMAKFNFEYAKRFEKDGAFFKEKTLLLEFSRGREDGYRKYLNQLNPAIFKNSAILFIDVSYEESFRRNEARYQEKLKHSILAHKVAEYPMTVVYRTHDWALLTQNKTSGFLNLRGVDVPFVTMHNEPEWSDPVKLDSRYGPALRQLMELRCLKN